ncbi:hypothetical protein LV476_03430 [Guyparkeria hydrothermalis]|uniref:hypothetical protein n=1 Tax=Guyparkeria hydrothermalis TaxID=923 RepID=UPI00202284B0|nr:hypothetical protein [Guyparkeria hydrothermalis]MCL7744004.1 hypothetical protein [Guyparkeria hydrothermalis]
MWMLAGVLALIGLTVYLYRTRRKDQWKLRPFPSKVGKRQPAVTAPDGALYTFKTRPNRPPLHRFGYEKAPDVEMRVKRKRWWDRPFTAVGISVTCRTGNPDFDRAFYLVTDVAPVCRAMSMSPRTQAMMLDIKAASESTGVQFRQFVLRRGQIWIEVATKKRKQFVAALPTLAKVVVPSLRELSEVMETELPDTARHMKDHVTPKAALISSIGGALFIGGIFLLLRQIFFPQPAPLETWPLVEAALLAAPIGFGLLVVLTLTWMGRTSRTHVVLLELLVTGLIGAGLTSYSLLREANMALDFSPGERHVVEVREKEVSQGRHTHYYLHLAPWHESQDFTEFSVSSSLFDAVREGFPLVIEEHPGALGIGWVRLIPPRFRHVEESTASTSPSPTP